MSIAKFDFRGNVSIINIRVSEETVQVQEINPSKLPNHHTKQFPQLLVVRDIIPIYPFLDFTVSWLYLVKSFSPHSVFIDNG